MITFSDLTKQLHTLNDMILTDMVCMDEVAEEAISFSRHLLATKNWYSRISWANKKRYVLALLEDVRSAWTLSLLLKSLWNCRPKDAVLSNMQKPVWSSYDEVPMDHNRTTLPTTTLAQVMKTDRLWFHSLDPEAQAMVLAELLIVAGGPVMWTALRRAQLLYERYRSQQLQNVQECIVVGEPTTEKQTSSPDKTPKKETLATSGRKVSTGVIDNEDKFEPGHAEKEMEANLAAWNATIKSMKDNLKLEEIEMTFTDGFKKKIWKVNRPKPEAIETVDFVQLLPSSIAKQILLFLPRYQLGDYSRVNKYWAFLVDELKAELAARQKLNSDFEKLNFIGKAFTSTEIQLLKHVSPKLFLKNILHKISKIDVSDIMACNDTTMNFVTQIDLNLAPTQSSQGNFSVGLSYKVRPPPSIKPSERSWGVYSFRHLLSDKLVKSFKQRQVPIRNLAELSDRLNKRGAADESLWSWCENILKNAEDKPDNQEGLLTLGTNYFGCPMMKKSLRVPLDPPLNEDPALLRIRPLKSLKNISHRAVFQAPKGVKRYHLWTKDFSGLYPVFKIPSYQF